MKANISRLAVLMGTALSLMAGAFVLQIGDPSANPEAEAKHAVLVVRGIACIKQEKTTVTGTAEGLVNRERQSMSLKLTQLSPPGTYAVTRQWPTQGTWVLIFVMTNPYFGGQRSAILKLDNGFVDWASITNLGRVPTRDDIEAALDGTPVAER